MYLGVEELVKFMRGFLESWSHMTIEAEDITEADGGTVVANVRQSGVGSGSRAKTDFRYSQVWSFRGGKVIRLENFREHAEASKPPGCRSGRCRRKALRRSGASTEKSVPVARHPESFSTRRTKSI